jgi:hypothetical protein
VLIYSTFRAALAEPDTFCRRRCTTCRDQEADVKEEHSMKVFVVGATGVIARR